MREIPMNNPTREQLRRTHGERGTSLIIALVFISVFGLMLAALGSFSEGNNLATGAYRSQRAANYATNAALDAAVNKVAHDPNIGVDPALAPTDACNPTNNATVMTQPATGSAPNIVVSCQVTSGSESGAPAELGSAPPYALLTLGDRRTTSNDGTVSQTNLGARNTEPPPYNVSSSDACSSDAGAGYQENGIRQNETVMSGRWLVFFPTCGSEPDNYAWNVEGNVFSNSKVQIDTPNAVPTVVSDPSGTKGTIEARGGCFGTGFGSANTTCTNPGWDLSDGKGRDPGLVTPAAYAPQVHTNSAGTALVDAGGNALTVQSVPPASQCTNARKLVTFNPGIYTDATALNALFANSSCKLATFWFVPGTYYFDFRNSSTSAQCGTSSWLDFIPDIQQNTAHQWCIAGAGDDYGNQHVIGGTPYNWAPTADPTNHVITLESTKAGAGPGQFFGIFPQPTQFVPGDGCASPLTVNDCGKTIDGKTDNYAMASGKTGSSIWLSSFQSGGATVPRGSYNNGIDLEIAQAADNASRMNPPTISVSYQTVGFLGLKTTGTCGPYTLPTPASGLSTVKLSVVNPAAKTNLSACLNTGDKINSAVVQYNVNRPLFQGSPYATAKLDGVRIDVTAEDQPSFPRPPSETDPGGDCDPTAPGVQFIFGGDSHVYLPNGAMELCAGPNPSNQITGQQLAVYGVPATPRLVPTAATGASNPDNAKVIAEGSGLVYATMTTTAPNNAVTLSYPGFATPSGYSVGQVQMRSSFDASSAANVVLQSSSGTPFPGPACNNNITNAPGVTSNPVQTQITDVTACLNTGGRLGSAFKVKWTAGPTGTPKLDGVEFVVTLTPSNADATLRPQNGCITASPNYWYGMASGVSLDCSVVRVDSRFQTPIGGVFGGVRQGRLSVKGTIYAPSAVVDVDDTDVWYPLASRGIVARSLRIRGFQYHPGYNGAAFDSYVDKTPSTRQVVFLACAKSSGACTPTDSSLVGRAAVQFEAKTGNPSIQAWSVGNI
jgi:hypothetical protein